MEMETSTEPMDPLTPSVAALGVQPEGGCGEQDSSPRAHWLLLGGGSGFHLVLSFPDLEFSCLRNRFGLKGS